MSQTTHVNYLSRLSRLKDVTDIRSRVALLALTAVAVALPVAQVVIPAIGQGRIAYLGQITGLGGASGTLIAACAVLLIAPLFPRLSQVVRLADIGLALVAILLGWLAWSGLGEVQASVERVAAFGLLVDETYGPVTSWRWGAPFAIAAFGLSLWRGVMALTRPLHTPAS